MEFRKSESFQYPVLEDTKSSPKGVFIRKNVVESQYTSEESGETKTKYTYDEAFIGFDEYQALSATQFAVEQSNKKSEQEVIDNYTEGLVNSGVLG